MKYFILFNKRLAEVLPGIKTVFLLKVLSAIASFLLTFLLAKTLGAESVGIYFLSFAILTIIATLGGMGMENMLVKSIAINLSSGKFSKIFGIYNKSMLIALIASGVLAITLFFMAHFISAVIYTKPELEYPLKIMAFAVVPVTMLTLHAYALQGLKKISISVSILSLFVPTIASSLVLMFTPRFGLIGAVISYVCATFLTLAISKYFWNKETKQWSAIDEHFSATNFLKKSQPFLVISMMNMVFLWLPVLILGVWETSENVGIYNVASRTAMLTSFVLIAVNSVVAPRYAELFHQNNLSGLNKLAKRTTSLLIIFTLPVLILFLLFPEYILSIFGSEFEHGGMVLIILSIGQFINVSTGSSGYLLMMCGQEDVLKNNILFFTILCTTLLFALVPYFGIIGAAVVIAITTSLRNFSATYLVWKRLRILALPTKKFNKL